MSSSNNLFIDTNVALMNTLSSCDFLDRSPNHYSWMPNGGGCCHNNMSARLKEIVGKLKKFLKNDFIYAEERMERCLFEVLVFKRSLVSTGSSASLKARFEKLLQNVDTLRTDVSLVDFKKKYKDLSRSFEEYFGYYKAQINPSDAAVLEYESAIKFKKKLEIVRANIKYKKDYINRCLVKIWMDINQCIVAESISLSPPPYLSDLVANTSSIVNSDKIPGQVPDSAPKAAQELEQEFKPELKQNLNLEHAACSLPQENKSVVVAGGGDNNQLASSVLDVSKLPDVADVNLGCCCCLFSTPRSSSGGTSVVQGGVVVHSQAQVAPTPGPIQMRSVK